MFEIPERFNLAHYYLDARVEEGLDERQAIVHHGGGTYTYLDVQRESNRMANALVERGVEQEDRVLIVLPDCPEFAFTWFGVLKAGAVFAMVNPRLKPDDYPYYLEYTRAKVLVTSADVYEKIAHHLPHARHLKEVIVHGDTAPEDLRFSRILAHASPEFENVDTHRGDVAGWLFTSGSTGHPKAAVHRHHDYAWNTERYAKQVLGICPDDVTLSVAKLYFGYATGTNLMFPFAVGASTVLFDGASKPELLFDLIEAYKPTMMTNVPTMIGKMLAQPDCPDRGLSSLRLCLSAGEALPAELYERWVERTGVGVSRKRFGGVCTRCVQHHTSLGYKRRCLANFPIGDR